MRASTVGDEGYWNGAKSYLLCAHCHNPHAPAFKPIEPLPPPVRPQFLAGCQRGRCGRRDATEQEPTSAWVEDDRDRQWIGEHSWQRRTDRDGGHRRAAGRRVAGVRRTDAAASASSNCLRNEVEQHPRASWSGTTASATGKNVSVTSNAAQDGVEFGYGLDICRDASAAAVASTPA